MVISKRCKICAALDADNVPISGEYFGKAIPILVERICGVELDERKINGVLICLHCVSELVLTDVVIDKLRNSVQRLKKTAKQRKPKTPSKEAFKKSASDNGQADEDYKKELINGSINEESPFEDLNNTKPTLDDTILKTRKKVFPDDKLATSLKVDTTPKKTKQGAKRKLRSVEDAVDNSGIVDLNATQENVSKSKPKKRSKDIAATVDHETNSEELSDKVTKSKVHNCVLCLKAFQQKSALRDHIDACHMGEKLKECPQCSTEFRSMQKYESHVLKEKCKNIKSMSVSEMQETF